MKVAIIGAGIVGSTAAYYLSKEAQVDVTVYDHGVGQATKAAAGIISPWFSKRRNKAWYRLARLGADFYQELVEDLAKDDRCLSPQEKGGKIRRTLSVGAESSGRISLDWRLGDLDQRRSGPTIPRSARL